MDTQVDRTKTLIWFIPIRDILRKILTMKKISSNDEGRRQKLTALEAYNNSDEETNGLGEFVDISDALTRSPRNSAKLRKCKSMVKKSKVCTTQHRLRHQMCKI